MTDHRLNEFCQQISRIVGHYPSVDVPRRVAELLPGFLADPTLLTAAERALPDTGYGRNLMFVCPADGFSLMAVVWPPGISTPIHDHATWCAFGLYEGNMRETHYAATGQSADTAALAEATARFDHTAGAIAHLPVAAPNIHCMHNPTDAVAISIHVYGGNAEKLGPNVETVYSVAA